MDRAAIKWSKVFGGTKDDTHWTRAFPKEMHEEVRAGMLQAIGLDMEGWEKYRGSLVGYRDQLAAHHDLDAAVTHFPHFDKALDSADFMYTRLLALLDQAGAGGLPSDLQRWASGVAKNMAPIVSLAFAASAKLGNNMPPKKAAG